MPVYEENRIKVAKMGARFDSINAALAEVAARGDNSAAKPYVVEVYPGTYNEVVTLEDPALRNIIITAPHKEVFVDGFKSTLNNANLVTLYVVGLFVAGATDLVGEVNGTTFLQNDCEFVGCQLSGIVTVRNTVTVSFVDCKLDSDLNVTNVLIGILAGEQGQNPGAALNVTWDQGGNKPTGTTDTFWIVSHAITGTATVSRIGTAGGSATLQMRHAPRLGTGGSAHSIGAGCTLQVFQGRIRGALTIAAGATFDDQGATFDPDLFTNNGTYTRNANYGLDLGAHLTHSANQSIPAGAFTALTFDTERYDLSGMHDGANPTRLTVSKRGKYLIGGCPSFAANAVGTRMAGIRLNGGNFIVLDSRPVVVDALLGTAIPVTTEWDLVPGDYVELVVFQNSLGALDVLKAADYSPEFWIRKSDKGG